MSDTFVFTPGTEHFRRNPLRAQLDVLYALVLHDIKSRFFGNGLGYIVTIIWPGCHIAIVIVARSLFNKAGAYGDSPFLYAATAVMPFIAWNYISRFTMMSAVQNKPYLNYPIVTLLDVMLARVFLELVTTTIVLIGLCFALYAGGVDVMPKHPEEAAFGLLSAVLLGIGFGLPNGVIASIFPFWQLAFILVVLAAYFTSGAFVNPEDLPDSIAQYLAWNPLLHSVEWIRAAYYDDFPTRLLSKSYVIWVAVTMTTLGLVAERLRRLI